MARNYLNLLEEIIRKIYIAHKFSIVSRAWWKRQLDVFSSALPTCIFEIQWCHIYIDVHIDINIEIILWKFSISNKIKIAMKLLYSSAFYKKEIFTKCSTSPMYINCFDIDMSFLTSFRRYF